MNTDCVWTGYLSLDDIKERTAEAFKIACPRHSYYEHGHFWLPAKYIQNLLHNSNSYYKFSIPETESIEIIKPIADGVEEKVTVNGWVLTNIFGTQTDSIKGIIGDPEGYDINHINFKEVNCLLSNSFLTTQLIASQSGLSEEIVKDLRQGRQSLLGLRVGMLSSLQRAVHKNRPLINDLILGREPQLFQ